MADIDLSGFDGKDGRCAFNVIGNQAVPFAASSTESTHDFASDGRGCTNLGCSASWIPGQGRDLGLVDANVVGTGYYVVRIGGAELWHSGTVLLHRRGERWLLHWRVGRRELGYYEQLLQHWGCQRWWEGRRLVGNNLRSTGQLLQHGRHQR